ncbi:hypothetical protein J6590_096312 [Homalodisca vitripennis]|nr:hypothetical protein J6590_096312 [Homalodisca vitripennis]
MSKKNIQTPKYPCGVCSVGVKYSGIRCTGSCDKWYHGGCINITEKRLKKMTEDEVHNWTCNSCNTIVDPQNSSLPEITVEALGESQQIPMLKTPRTPRYQSKVLFEDPINKDYSPRMCPNDMNEIHTKIQDLNNQENDDLEASLTLAAEAGNALLSENYTLKQDLSRVNMENTELRARIFDLEKKIQPAYDEQIANLENEKEHILQRNETLQNMFHEMEKQIGKEKEMQEQLTRAFEEHDKEKEELIRSLEKKIKNLLHETNSKASETASNPLEENETILKNSETQTCTSEPYAMNTNSYLLTQLTELKVRQEKMEKLIETIQHQNQDGSSNLTENFSIAAPTCSTAEACFQGKKQNKNKNTPIKHQTKHKTDNRKNIFSVSLQVAKFRLNPEPNTASVTTETYTLENSTKKLPPYSAQQLKPKESLEDFYNRNINKLIKPQNEAKRPLALNQPENKMASDNAHTTQSSTPTLPVLEKTSQLPSSQENQHFLLPTQKKKFRNRTFLNSTLKLTPKRYYLR